MKILNTKWDSQRDNKIDPYKTCFPTSIAALLRTLEQLIFGGKGRDRFLREDSEDILIQELVDNRSFYTRMSIKVAGSWAARYYPRYVWAWWRWYINNKCPGYVARFKVVTQEFLKMHVDAYGLPVIIGTKLTASGHIVMMIGSDQNGFHCNDPYGNANNNYKDQNGFEVYYRDSMLPKKINCLFIDYEDELNDFEDDI